MEERAWQDELQRFLEIRFQAVCRLLGQVIPASGLRIQPPLTPDEAKYFLLGLESGFFELDEEGSVQSPLLRTPTGTKQNMVFWRNPPQLSLYREGICQLSTAAALILDRGWLERQIEVEPAIRDDGLTADGVDILVRTLAGKLLAGVEIKRSVHELAKLKSDFGQCCRRGLHPKDNCGFPQNHGIFEFCAAYRPAYLWAVAPDDNICFTMNYSEGGTIQLEELSTLPPRSIVEMRCGD